MLALLHTYKKFYVISEALQQNMYLFPHNNYDPRNYLRFPLATRKEAREK